ncbi:hypothetical protein B0O99DRAFT_654119 [Bisporella sp. PMI_857]|nr:hypothetical protein B0O99DRAFT_654119 [Bisporella sp. PMI_857]
MLSHQGHHVWWNLGFGFDISSMSAIVGTDQYIEYIDNPHGIIQGPIGSSLAAGSIVGSVMAGPISDKFGRRDSIFVACIRWLVGTAIQVACKDYGQPIAGRVLNGVCVGITSSQVPVYLAEIAKHDKRGSIIVGPNEEGLTTLAKFQAKGDVNYPLVVAERESPTVYLGFKKFVAWQQLSDAGVMTYYVVYVFQMASLTRNINLISSAVQYTLFIIFTSVVVFIDKPVVVPYPSTVPLEWVYANSSYLLIIVYALTLAPVAWVYAAEVWSLETRATGMSLAAVANWLFNFAFRLFVPPAILNITYKTFIIFGVLCFGAAIQAVFTHPETCGKTLEEIELLFSKDSPHA